ncbi:glycosyltransferase [Bacteroidetes bacterium endosymbiont of Geopemphigus sp.]|uniref:glycosyltransferase n=1 Tax=Bacteroidetes bacterium endosymbiont of Geopemphigus sp. TaxID=2047937 RepID=UPI000CCFDFA9|nr:glycosyltransferase [Bacteroidetes bacterium endosymbiont of Geopemphigus sp.]
MKKILLFILPDLCAGGAERITTILVNHVDRDQFLPKLLLLKKAGLYLDMLKKDVEVIDIHVYKIRYSLFKLLKAIRKLKPDIAFCGYGELNAFIAPFLPFFKKTRFIARETNIVSEHVVRREILFFYRFYNNFHKIIAQSEDMKADLIENMRIRPEKIVKINNPIDMDLITKKLSSIEKPGEYFKDKKNILAVGSLNNRKGFDNLLKVFSFLKSLAVHLFIIGEGPEKKKLLELKRKLALDNVSFLGLKKNPFIYMKHADLFVLSSRYEGFPNVLLEANACGTPIFANHCKGGIDEIIESGINGEYAAIEDHKKFSQRILKILKEKERYKDLRERTEKKYSINNIFPFYYDVFNSLR